MIQKIENKSKNNLKAPKFFFHSLAAWPRVDLEASVSWDEPKNLIDDKTIK